MQHFLIHLFLKTLYVFQAVPPPIVRSTQLYIQLQILSTVMIELSTLLINLYTIIYHLISDIQILATHVLS